MAAAAVGDEPPVRMHTDGIAYADRSVVGEGGPTRLEAWRTTTSPIRLHRRLTDEVALLQRATGRLSYFAKIQHSDSSEAQHQVQVREHHLQQVAEILEEMMESGMQVPVFDAELAHELIATGMISRPEELTADQVVPDLLKEERPTGRGARKSGL